MGFAQLARVLVREFGKGNSYRKILTQKINDKHFIKVFDKSGNTLVNRVKTFEKSVVGNKKVITRKEATLFNNLDGSNSGYKANFDRVYNSAGELAGTRHIEYSAVTRGQENPLSLIDTKNYFITKQGPEGCSITKQVIEGKNRLFWKNYGDLGSRINGEKLSKNKHDCDGFFNLSGLPMPLESGDMGLLSYGGRNIPRSINEMCRVSEKHYIEWLEWTGTDIKTIKRHFPNYYTGNPHLNIPLWGSHSAQVGKPEDLLMQQISNLDKFI